MYLRGSWDGRSHWMKLFRECYNCSEAVLFVFWDRISLCSPGCPGTLCRPGWPRTQKSSCLCLSSAGIKALIKPPLPGSSCRFLIGWTLIFFGSTIDCCFSNWQKNRKAGSSLSLPSLLWDSDQQLKKLGGGGARRSVGGGGRRQLILFSQTSFWVSKKLCFLAVRLRACDRFFSLLLRVRQGFSLRRVEPKRDAVTFGRDGGERSPLMSASFSPGD
jgi:hypothetical protein